MSDLEEYFSDDKKIHKKIISDKNDELNGWDKQNNETIKTWKTQCEELSFVYDFTMHKYKDRVKILDLITFVVSVIIAGLSLSNMGLNKDEYPELYLGQQILFLIFSMITSVTSGVPTIMKWNDKVKAYTKYSEKVEGFYNTIVSEITLPIKLRRNGLDFIVQNKNNYSEIVRSAPDIGPSEYKKAVDFHTQKI